MTDTEPPTPEREPTPEPEEEPSHEGPAVPDGA
jgi:hypothetical protein